MKKMRICFMMMVAIGFMLAAIAGAQDKELKKINLNTASVEELEKVKGIGPKLAGKIVEYRKANGPFKKAEDIVNVPGIGPKFWEANKDRFMVESPPGKSKTP